MQLYGTTGGKEWALLSSLPPGMELEGFARQAADEHAGSGQGGRLVVAGIQ